MKISHMFSKPRTRVPLEQQCAVEKTPDKPIELRHSEGVPTRGVLHQLLSAAQKQPGRGISVAWTCEGTHYELCAKQDDQKKTWHQKARDPHAGEPEWTLFRATDPSQEPTKILHLVTDNADLVLNMITCGLLQAKKELKPLPSILSIVPDIVLTESETRGGGCPWVYEQEATQQLQKPLPLSPVPEMNTGSIQLSGNIQEVELANVVQSISLCKMTGRLNLGNSSSQAELWFQEGELVHAAFLHLSIDWEEVLTGEDAVIELFTWEHGTFEFHHGWRASARTITKRMENLVLEALTVRDYKNFLHKVGLTDTTLICRANASEPKPEKQDYESRTLAALDESLTLEQLLLAVPMSQCVWVPLLFNLFNRKVISFHNDIEYGHNLGFFQVGEGGIEPSARILKFPLFLASIYSEISRFNKTALPFSLAAIDLDQVLAKATLSIVGELFEQVKKPYYVLAYEQPSTLFVLLPQTQLEEAYTEVELFVGKILEKLGQDGSGTEGFYVATGLATYPKDGATLRELLATVMDLKQKAKSSRRAFCTSTPVAAASVSDWMKLCGLATEARATNRLAEAEKIWLLALARARQLPDSSKKLSYAARQLAQIYSHQRQLEKAETMLLTALTAATETQENTHPAVLELIDELARCYYMQGKYAEAEDTAKACVRICQHHFGESNTRLATTLYNLAQLYHMQNKFTDAEPLYLQALTIRRNILGEDSASTQKVARNYAQLRQSMNEKAARLRITGTWQALTMPGMSMFEELHDSNSQLLG